MVTIEDIDILHVTKIIADSTDKADDNHAFTSINVGQGNTGIDITHKTPYMHEAALWHSHHHPFAVDVCLRELSKAAELNSLNSRGVLTCHGSPTPFKFSIAGSLRHFLHVKAVHDLSAMPSSLPRWL